MCPLLYPRIRITDTHLTQLPYVASGHGTQVLVFVWQLLSQLSHLPDSRN